MTAREVRVLVVDDDDDVREMVCLVLEQSGLRVGAARDGVEAFERLDADGATDLILLDLRMPRLNGADFLARLRADPERRATPVVLFSGDHRARETAEAWGTGFLLKPFGLDELLRTVNAFARPSR